MASCSCSQPLLLLLLLLFMGLISASAQVGPPSFLPQSNTQLSNLANFSDFFFFLAGGNEASIRGATVKICEWEPKEEAWELSHMCTVHLLWGPKGSLLAFPLLLFNQLQHTQQALWILLFHPKDMQLLKMPSLENNLVMNLSARSCFNFNLLVGLLICKCEVGIENNNIC